MPIDRATVRHVASLARLRIDPEEEERWVRELGAILAYVEQLQALDVSDIEPTSQVGAGAPAPLRPDEERPSDVREEVLKQAPDRDGDFFRVPQVV
ncbi:MAG TPA: Asp-tRNA(Asn)/Glu-tRNA(Gln) amidotransferase subunit GatC [Candidatus Eisenbacteria bacterium]|jgi:aspartyl-tRNA(Asn)/glutamyl-tRNA(Gln) amidotransferase subunit C